MRLPAASLKKKHPGRLLLIDVMALLFRGHFAHGTRPVVRPQDARVTSGLSSVARYVLRACQLIKPTHIVASLDHINNKASRKETLHEYKITRPPTAEEITWQIRQLPTLFANLGIPIMTADRFEGDDCIGAMVQKLNTRHVLFNSYASDYEEKKLTTLRSVYPEHFSSNTSLDYPLFPEALATTLDAKDMEFLEEETHFSPKSLRDELYIGSTPVDGFHNIPFPSSRSVLTDQLQMSATPSLASQFLRESGLLNSSALSFVSMNPSMEQQVTSLEAYAPNTFIDHAYILTYDKDFFQLVNKNVSVMRPEHNTFAVFTPEDVKQEFGVHPEQFLDFLAMSGDQSDNIPGVPSLGVVTTKNLLQHFSSFEDVFESACAAIGADPVTLRAAAFEDLRAGGARPRTYEDLKFVPIPSDTLSQISPFVLSKKKFSRAGVGKSDTTIESTILDEYTLYARSVDSGATIGPTWDDWSRSIFEPSQIGLKDVNSMDTVNRVDTVDTMKDQDEIEKKSKNEESTSSSLNPNLACFDPVSSFSASPTNQPKHLKFDVVLSFVPPRAVKGRAKEQQIALAKEQERIRLANWPLTITKAWAVVSGYKYYLVSKKLAAIARNVPGTFEPELSLYMGTTNDSTKEVLKEYGLTGVSRDYNSLVSRNLVIAKQRLATLRKYNEDNLSSPEAISMSTVNSSRVTKLKKEKKDRGYASELENQSLENLSSSRVENIVDSSEVLQIAFPPHIYAHSEVEMSNQKKKQEGVKTSPVLSPSRPVVSSPHSPPTDAAKHQDLYDMFIS